MERVEEGKTFQFNNYFYKGRFLTLCPHVELPSCSIEDQPHECGAIEDIFVRCTVCNKTFQVRVGMNCGWL